MANFNDNDPIAQWCRELRAAGWKEYQGSLTLWESPAGHLFRGPFKAWELMQKFPQLNKPKLTPDV